eukprot:TRINITY_DN27899_c0_g1_i1.p1 TRINITY_DN27899_c0_g1~~TRINITY_DN27899_c0_g1_i1.p1  ORF type:complete len:635 (-),score=91.51 TRINITY_DN27899_c0_g1_i1:228-2132(-)
MSGRPGLRDRCIDSAMRSATTTENGGSIRSKQAAMTTVYKPKACRSLSRFFSFPPVPNLCMERAKTGNFNEPRLHDDFSQLKKSRNFEPHAEPTPEMASWMRGGRRSAGSNEFSDPATSRDSLRRGVAIRSADMSGRQWSSTSMSPSQPLSPSRVIQKRGSVGDSDGAQNVHGQPNHKTIRGDSCDARSRTDSGLSLGCSGRTDRFFVLSGGIDHDLTSPAEMDLLKGRVPSRTASGSPRLATTSDSARRPLPPQLNAKASEPARQLSPGRIHFASPHLKNAFLDEGAVGSLATRRFRAKQGPSVGVALRGEQGRSSSAASFHGGITVSRSRSVDALVDNYNPAGYFVGVTCRSARSSVDRPSTMGGACDLDGRSNADGRGEEVVPCASCASTRVSGISVAVGVGGSGSSGGGGGWKQRVSAFSAAGAGKSNTCENGCNCPVCNARYSRPAGLNSEIHNINKSIDTLRFFNALPKSYCTRGGSPLRTRYGEPPRVEESTRAEVSTLLSNEVPHMHRIGRSLSTDDIFTGSPGSDKVDAVPAKRRVSDILPGQKVRSQHSEHISAGTEILGQRKHADFRNELPPKKSPPGSPHASSVVFPPSPGSTTTDANEMFGSGVPTEEIDARIMQSRFGLE